MAQVATLLNEAEKTRFGAYLLDCAERMISEAVTRDDERSIRKAICKALSQPSLNRLRAYANGDHFPTPKLVRALAGALDYSSLALLRSAGYDREVIHDLHYLRVAGRASRISNRREALVEYAVRLFPRRGERYRAGRGPGTYRHALAETILPTSLSSAIEGADRRVPLPKPLACAYDILGYNSLEVECRLAIAGELVRSWAYAVDANFARSIEQSTYLRAPGVGERALTFPQIGPLDRAANASRRQP